MLNHPWRGALIQPSGAGLVAWLLVGEGTAVLHTRSCAVGSGTPGACRPLGSPTFQVLPVVFPGVRSWAKGREPRLSRVGAEAVEEGSLLPCSYSLSSTLRLTEGTRLPGRHTGEPVAPVTRSGSHRHHRTARQGGTSSELQRGTDTAD